MNQVTSNITAKNTNKGCVSPQEKKHDQLEMYLKLEPMYKLLLNSCVTIQKLYKSMGSTTAMPGWPDQYMQYRLPLCVINYTCLIGETLPLDVRLSNYHLLTDKMADAQILQSDTQRCLSYTNP